MKNVTYLLFLFFWTAIVNSQNVGVNTTNPQATLHVVGDFKFIPDASVTATRLVASTPNGDIAEIPLSDEFNIVDGRLEVNETVEENVYLVGNYDQSPNAAAFSTWNNMDLDIFGDNEFNTVIRVTGETANYEVTGFADGFDGRIIYFYNAQSFNTTFQNLDPRSDPENQILVGTFGSESISGEGVVEFVYEGSSQKWILVNIRG